MKVEDIKEISAIYRTISTPEDNGRFALFVAIVCDMTADEALRTVNGSRNYITDEDNVEK